MTHNKQSQLHPTKLLIPSTYLTSLFQKSYPQQYHIMATSTDFLRLEEQLKCPVCLDTYTNPKILPCHHSFCQECLEKLPRKGLGRHLLSLLSHLSSACRGTKKRSRSLSCSIPPQQPRGNYAESKE